MGAIIRMDSKQFLKKFVKDENYKNFNFILVSEDVKTVNKYSNVYAIRSLLPPPNILSIFVNEGMSDKYIKKYIDYLSNPKIEAMLTVIVKLAVIENSNVVLLCSKNEDEFGYIKIICKYIEKIYNVKTYSYKKYKSNPEECEKVKDKKKVVKILDKKLNEFDGDATPNIDKKELKRRLESLSKKELKGYCKYQSISFDKDDSKEKLIKKIIKAFSY